MECLANVLDKKFPQFNTVSPEHALRDALYQMSCENLEYLVVLKEEEFVGILSEQDVAHKLFASSLPIEALRVRDIMNVRLPIGNVSDDVDHAMGLINRHNSRYIAVFDEFVFKGIVSEKDLLRIAVERRASQAGDERQKDRYQWAY